jgi:hypothetical protein
MLHTQLFGDANPDEKRFQEAIKACALEPDIAMRASRLSLALQSELVLTSTRSEPWLAD